MGKFFRRVWKMAQVNLPGNESIHLPNIDQCLPYLVFRSSADLHVRDGGH